MDTYTENDLVDLDLKYGHSLVRDEDALKLIEMVRHYRQTYGVDFAEFSKKITKLLGEFGDRLVELESEVVGGSDEQVTCDDLKKIKAQMFELLTEEGVMQDV